LQDTLKPPVNCWYQAGDFAKMKNSFCVALFPNHHSEIPRRDHLFENSAL